MFTHLRVQKHSQIENCILDLGISPWRSQFFSPWRRARIPALTLHRVHLHNFSHLNPRELRFDPKSTAGSSQKTSPFEFLASFNATCPGSTAPGRVRTRHIHKSSHL